MYATLPYPAEEFSQSKRVTLLINIVFICYFTLFVTLLVILCRPGAWPVHIQTNPLAMAMVENIAYGASSSFD